MTNKYAFALLMYIYGDEALMTDGELKEVARVIRAAEKRGYARAQRKFEVRYIVDGVDVGRLSAPMVMSQLAED